MVLDPRTEAMHYDAQGRLAQLGSYQRWVLRNFRDAFGKRIWDAGAGIGLVTGELAQRAELVLATEYTPRNLETLRARFAETPNVTVARCDLAGDDSIAFAAHALDTVVSLDVLEHLQDDRHVLGLFHRVLVPGGRLLLKVPAHPFLFGAIDEASSHLRRYRRRLLRERLVRAGFEVERLEHMNLAATVPYFVKSRILKRRTNFSNSIDPNRLGLYDRIIPWLERAERILPVPFGLSLIAVARKPVG